MGKGKKEEGGKLLFIVSLKDRVQSRLGVTPSIIPFNDSEIYGLKLDGVSCGVIALIGGAKGAKMQ